MVDAIAKLGGDAAGIMHSQVRDTAAALEILSRYWPGPKLAYAEKMRLNEKSSLGRSEHSKNWYGKSNSGHAMLLYFLLMILLSLNYLYTKSVNPTFNFYDIFFW